MFKKTNLDPVIDYNIDFKVIIGTNSPDNDQLKVHQSQNSLKSLESFSRSSESLALPVTKLDSRKERNEKRKKKSHSATRSCVKDEKKSTHLDETVDMTVSRDQGESFMSEIMRNVKQESREIIGDCEEDRLRLMNIRLESKVSRLSQESEKLLCEKSQIKCELETMRQNLIDTKAELEVIEEELELAKREKNIDKRKATGLETALIQKQAELSSKMVDFEQITSELHEFQDNLSRSNEKIRLFTEELDRKVFVISDLKKKISEYHSQLELTKLYQENSEYQSEQLKLELAAMKKARHWFEDQLKNVEETKEKLKIEVHRITTCLLESNHETETARQKNKSLDLKLAKFQEVKLHETMALLFELEQLQKEIIISEEEKGELEERYSEIMRRFNEKINEIEAEQERNRSLNEKIEDLTSDLDAVRVQYESAENNINGLETEGRELRKKLAVLEDKLNKQVEDLEITRREKIELENEFQELSRNLSEKDRFISGLKEEMENLKLSFDRVCSERNQACVGIEQLKDEITKVEEQFEITRQNLTSKEQVIQLVEDLKEELLTQLTKEKENVALRDKDIAILKSEKSQLLESCEQFQQNNLQILNELDMLRGNLNLANITIAGLEDELLGMKMENVKLTEDNLQSQNDVAKFKVDLKLAQEKVESLCNIQEMYSKLFDDHKRLEEGYNELYGQHKLLSDEFKQVTGELQAKLEEKEKELENIVSIKEEIVVTIQKDLQCADRSNKELVNELENVKFNHTVELSTKEEQFREYFENSSREFSEMCQEKIRCETAIGSLQQHIASIVDDHNKKLTEYKSKMLHLKQQSTEYAEFENQSRLLMEELERKKGETEAILEIWKKLKQHTEVLENALARRDAHVIHLMNDHDTILSNKEEEIKNLNDKLNSQCDRLKIEENIKNNYLCQLEERVTVIDEIRKKVDGYERSCSDMQLNNNKLKSKLETICRENQLLQESQQILTNELEKKIAENRNLMNANQDLLENVSQAVSWRESDKRTTQSLKQELDYNCNQRKQIDTNHDSLMKGNRKVVEEMASIVKDVTDQNDSLTRKVELSQQQDIITTTILNQLRSEVKKIIFQQEVERDIDNKVRLSSEQLDQLLELLNDTEEPTKIYKPHSRLSRCIEDLRTQIDSMQSEIYKQIDEHMQSETFGSEDNLE